MRTDTLIVGGGLCGLSLAHQLTEADRDFLLLEARDRLGGRILTEDIDGASFDLGPAWFWPGQPRTAALIQKLGLSQFEQFSEGALSFEDENGRVERGRGFSSMQGSFRLDRGFGSLITALTNRIPDSQIRLSAQVQTIAKTDEGASVTTADGARFEAGRVVLALPLRLASQLTFIPELRSDVHAAMSATPTWMAGQAKAVAVYDTPFWRKDGFSGDAMSRFGPMVEIHDASPKADGPFALFGFVGVPPNARRDEARLQQAVIAQLVRLFGPKAGKPRKLFIKDWAFDHYTSTELDLNPLYAHPNYGLPNTLRGIWKDRLILSGTETAAQFGGYLEGALEAAENALTLISHKEV